MHMLHECKRLTGAAEVKLCKAAVLRQAKEAVRLDSDRDSKNASTKEQPEPCSRVGEIKFSTISIFQGDVAAQ